MQTSRKRLRRRAALGERLAKKATADLEALPHMDVDLPEATNASASVRQPPKTAVRKLPAKVATTSATETSNMTPTPEEEAQWLAQLDVVDQEPDLSDYNCDNAEADSDPVIGPDFDVAPFMAAWKRRQQSNGKQAEHQETEENDEDPLSRLRGLVAEANKGDSGALSELKEMLDTRPEIWQTIGNLASHAELAMINLVSGGDQLLAESLRRHIAQLNITLVGPNPNLLEQLTVQRVVASWLYAQFVDQSCATADSGTNPSNAWARRQQMAEKRYQTALKSLSLVQKMAPKSIQTAAASKTPIAVPGRPSDADEKDAATDSKMATCSSRDDACHSNSRSNSNGHGRAEGIIPKVNGKPINRVFAANARKAAALSGSAD